MQIKKKSVDTVKRVFYYPEFKHSIEIEAKNLTSILIL